MNAVIQLDGLSVRFGERTVLKQLTGALHGRCIGLLGPNGSGKSTLLNTLLGFFPAAQGGARIFGKDIRVHSRELRALIGYMPESDAFISNMSGVRFVRYMAELSGLPPRHALERAHEALFYVGLGEVRYRKVGTYSLGMKQLVKLAQAIAHGPRLIFLDEPTNGLDPPARNRMIQVIREIKDASDIRLVISSHLLRDVDECCDEVIILRDGHIAGICNIEEERRTNRKFLELETYGEENAFADAVQQLGCECALFGKGRMKVVLPESIEVRELYRLAATRDVQIRRMNYRRDSLEDIFLKAMEGVGARNGSL
jgi:ABC-2 type transport system ATP-binding protein